MTPDQQLREWSIQQRLLRLEQTVERAERIIAARRVKQSSAGPRMITNANGELEDISVEAMAARHRARMAEQRGTEPGAKADPFCGKCSAINAACQHHSALPSYVERHRYLNDLAKRWY